MNLVKKVLVAHGDPKLKRTLVLLMADAGYDVRGHVTADDALNAARGELFDLALVGDQLTGATGMETIEALKRIQPTVPIVLIADEPELLLIIKGIRLGLADVLPVGGDLRPLLGRVKDLLYPNGDAGSKDGVTSDEMAEVESVLARLGDAEDQAIAAAAEAKTSDLRYELLRETRERTDLEGKVQRLLHEKAALEAELKLLLTQNADAARQAQELAELSTQREMVSAAQAAIDAKARALAEQREEIARQRDALEEERRRLAESTPVLPDWAASAHEVETMRERVRVEEARLRDVASQLQQEAAQIARERRRWHEDLDLLRDQEQNLRDYEERLRKVQAKLETERVTWFSTQPPAESRSPFDDGALRDAWQKLQRASELLEAERSNLRDDRLITQEHEVSLKRREEAIAVREAKLAEAERRLRSSGSPPISAAPQPTAAPSRSKTRGPLERAKSVFSGKK